MLNLWHAIKAGYLRLIEPVAEWFIRHRVSPNVITTIGTACACLAGVIFASGHISLAGWTLGILAFFDVVDGTVARRTGKSTVFGAFYDSTLDRLSDGVLFGGLAFFYASNTRHHSLTMVTIALVGLLATFLTSYTRARAEALGIGMKGIGMMERPERIALLAAPQAFFGLGLDGWILRVVVTVLAVTAAITFVQRVRHVARVTATTSPAA
ncbi:MAG TPA: CDP-alcohol phosphatidyltransferase family protein [Gemmatimonadaceae bacterium]|nr:CDP-alcohol phosphatidyltransferase family protein [Gemmatimonadaceae bacterium]